MPQIFVVEPESRYVERIRDALANDAGWSVVAHERAERALQAAAGTAPDLVLVNVEVDGAEVLLSTFARQRGGRGAIALLPERRGGEAEAFRGRADAVLVKPFAEQDLRVAARRVLAGGKEALDATGHKLTSAEIFGDLLAEFQESPASRRSVAVDDDEINRKLEETLSGVLGAQRKPPAPAPAVAVSPAAATSVAAASAAAAAPKKPKSATDVDSLLSKLDLEHGRSKPAPRPAPAAVPSAASSPATGQSAPAPRVAPPASPIPSAPPPSPVSAGAPPVTPGAGPAAAPAPRPAFASMETPLSAAPTLKMELPPLAALEPPSVVPMAAPPPSPPIPPPLAAPPVHVAPVHVASEAAVTQRIPVSGLPGVEGREFGQYALLEKIAVGGMAEVWKARMKGVEGFQKTVAIKKILPHLTDNSAFLSMFIDEAKLAAQLAHPNITHIYDLGKIGPDYYIAMEYVEGRNLRALLNAARRQGVRFPLGLALMIGARLASALDYAHRKKGFDGHELGLVHRDVSPQNVLISNEGDIKLCDFGIVKAVSKASHTQMGALKGKLQYMSPEQAWGRQVDGRSDLFSLGAILFEMLTGRRLFPGENEISVLEAVRECRIEAPKALVPSIPDEVDALVRKALGREPGDRFQTAGAMQQALEHVLYALKPSQADLATFVHKLASGPSLPDTDSGSVPGDKLAAPWSAPVAQPAAPVPAAEPVRARPSGSAPRPAPKPEPVAPPSRLSASRAEVVAVPPPAGSEVELEEGGSRGKTALIAAIAATVLLGAVGVWMFMGRGKSGGQAPADGQAPPAAEAAADPTSVPPTAEDGTAALPADGAVPPSGETAVPPAAVATSPSAEPANMDVAQLVDRELAKREEDLRRKLEAEQKKLEQRLAEAKAAEEQRKVTEPAKEAAPPPPTTPPVSAAPAEPEPAPVEPEPVAEGRVEPERQAEAAAPPVAPPAAPQVELGQLVKMGPGVVPPSLVTFTKPEYPAVARRLRVEGTVEAEVLVDENGAVREARLSQPIRQDVGINEAALAAARGAKFRPATKDGVRVKIWTKIKIPFKL